MIRKFNYTDRKRILKENISFEWIEGEHGKPATFKATLNLLSVENLRHDGQVWVEAYSGATVARYNYGTVDNLIIPQDTGLIGFPRGLKPHFRIKVVDPDDPRKCLLAFADKIAPVDKEDLEAGRQSILPVEYVDLGQEIWSLRMDESLDPVLQLNNQIIEPVSISTLARTAEFAALVYPAVIRQILSRLLLETEVIEIDTDHDWLKFGNKLISSEYPDPEKYEVNDENFSRDSREWIDDVVKEFSRSRRTRDSYVEEKLTTNKDA